MRRLLLALACVCVPSLAVAQVSQAQAQFPALVAPAFASAIASLVGCSTTGTVLTGGPTPLCSSTPTVTSLTLATSLGTFIGQSAQISTLQNGATGQVLCVANAYTSASNNESLCIDGNSRRINMSSTGGPAQGALTFALSGTAIWAMAATGGHWLASTDNVTDIGASAATRPRTGYFGTSVISPLVNATTGVQINGAAASGNYLIGNGTNFVSLQPALMHANPANQTGNGTATFKMNGLGAAAAPCLITPVTTGRVIFTISGYAGNTTTLDSVQYKMAYGTGAPPANAAAATGTVISATGSFIALTGNLAVPFSMTSIATGLTLATAVWFDLQVADSAAAGTGQITLVDCTANEI